MSDRLLGTVLDGRYRIDTPLGAGSMGAVYRGVQISVGREVAIKLVHPQWVRNHEVVSRFVREAVLTSQLIHPNAVSVLDFGQTRDGTYYLVMELLSGRSLEDILRVERRLSPDRVVRIGSQICSALLSAHHLSILHRDLKPANVIMVDGLATHDHVKVVDFGIAKCLALDPSGRNTDITRVGALLGTPAYMPPEVLMGAQADQRSDLYSLGVIMYELATGRTPYLADNIPQLVTEMMTEIPPTPHELGVPGPLASIISALIARNPAHRYMDAAHLQAALLQLEYPGPTHMTPLPVRYDLEPPTPAHAFAAPPMRRRSAWPAVLACSLALALCAAALALGLLSAPAPGTAPPSASTQATSPLK
jgi:eukaryotic-like serine/threonine-protein kinase